MITKGPFSGGARALPSPFCNRTGPLAPVSHVITGTQCLSLTQVDAGSSAACEAACCAKADCATWVWGSAEKQCWVGPDGCVGPSNPDWNGASSKHKDVPPPPSPAPPLPSAVLPRLTPRPGSVQGVVGPPHLDLNGVWQFVPDATNTSLTPVPINVPGEYTLQGFRVPSGVPTQYTRTFALPPTWTAQKGLRVKLRADGIYSDCAVTVNGRSVGGHLGGFTPFELDVTEAVVGGSNRIAINVTGSSLADTLAAGQRYAVHDLGGITRKIYLIAVPEVSVSDVWATTTFTDSSYTDAWLNVSHSRPCCAPLSGLCFGCVNPMESPIPTLRKRRSKMTSPALFEPFTPAHAE